MRAESSVRMTETKAVTNTNSPFIRVLRVVLLVSRTGGVSCEEYIPDAITPERAAETELCELAGAVEVSYM